MSSSAISAAGKPPDELKPNWPNDVINMNVKLVLLADSSAAVTQCNAAVTNTVKKRQGSRREQKCAITQLTRLRN